MPVTTDIVATYRGPRRVMRRLMAMTPNEGRALAIVMSACLVVFIAQWPRLARVAHLNDQEINPLLGGALMAWVFIMPLVLYALAFLSFLVLRIFSARTSGYGCRLALFWAVLAVSPLFLLNGLVAGFIGAGAGLQLIGFVTLLVFMWFWLANLREVGWGET